MFDRLWLSARSLFLRRRLEREMQEEMASHLERAAHRLEQRGLDRTDARYAARREFGNVEALQEEARDVRGGRWLETLVADLRFGLRNFLRTPMATATMVSLLALGIGLNTAVFTLLHSMQTQPPPGIARADDLVRIRGINNAGPGQPDRGREFPYLEYREYASKTDLFSAVAAWTSADAVIATGQDQSILNSGAATFVTANYFPVLGVRPSLGAGLPAAFSDDDATQLVAVISHALWERQFAGSPDVIGQVIKVNGAAVTIVGVAPRAFTGARTGGSPVRVWLPLGARPIVQRTTASALASYDSSLFGVAARLRAPVDLAQALPAVQAIAARTPLTPLRSAALSADVAPLLAHNYFPPANIREDGPSVGRWFLLLFPLLLLLIPCTNVSALLVGLAVSRQREVAVRLALGAERKRIVRQLMSETVILAMAGALVSLLIISVLLTQLGHRVPDVQLVLHWPAIAFTLGVALIAGIGFGITPALHATRVGVSDVLKNAAGQLAVRSRLQSAIVVVQIALTQPMLFALGTLILELSEDVRRLEEAPFGDRIAQVHFNTNPRYGAIDSTREAALGRLQARLASIPDVESVVAQGVNPDYAELTVHPHDRVRGMEERPVVSLFLHSAPSGYFNLMGYRLVSGREFDARENPRSIIIGADVARRLFGGSEAVGRQLVRAGDGSIPGFSYDIVGVVDTTHVSRESGDRGRAFVAGHRFTGSLLVRTRGAAQPVIPLIRAVAQTEAPSHPITSLTTLAAIEARQRSQLGRAFGAAALTGLIALLVSAIGLYAVGAFAVGQRTREIGIRSALGAEPQRVAGLFFRHGVRLSLTGVAVGLALTWFVSRVMIIAGAGGSTGLPLTTIALAGLITVMVVGVACLASWIPARRAARIDPLTALRAE